MPADAAEIVRLAELCEAGTTPSRDLDALIAPLQGLQVVDEGHPLGRVCYDRGRRAVILPRYTASLDAAMTLVDMPFDHIEVCPPQGEYTGWTVHIIPPAWGIINTLTGYAASYALAFTAAALKARARAAQHDHEVG